MLHHHRETGEPLTEAECDIYRVLRTGEGTHSDQEVFFRKNGSSFPVEYWSYPVHQEGHVGAVVTFLDITDRKQAEREIRLAAQRREQFLAMLSHELRNPLAAVLNATRVMHTQGDKAALSKATDVIERQSRHMARLLDDLLDVSRITQGGIELRKEDLDLRDAIELAVEAVRPHLDSHDTVLDMELPDEPLHVRGDRARLQQIIGNLLNNAAKYSPKGSRVELQARASAGEIQVTVRDEGYGISAELLPKIFDLFVQNEQGVDRSDGGLGVGLALVRQLVELHGGRVSAESGGLNQGSYFHVTLPRLAHSTLQPTKSLERTGAQSARQRVVIVEDQDDARDMLRALLQAKGYLVFEARDGKEAIETIEEVHPHAALVDLGLPVLNGFEVARQLRNNPVLNDVLLVALSGYGSSSDVEAARAAGFNHHLTKPAELAEIERVLTAHA